MNTQQHSSIAIMVSSCPSWTTTMSAMKIFNDVPSWPVNLSIVYLSAVKSPLPTNQLLILSTHILDFCFVFVIVSVCMSDLYCARLLQKEKLPPVWWTGLLDSIFTSMGIVVNWAWHGWWVSQFMISKCLFFIFVSIFRELCCHLHWSQVSLIEVCHVPPKN